jgi:hypothetical protein
MAIIKKSMGKPMKKAQKGTIIPENPDQAEQLNKMEAERQAKLKRAKGIPINPQIRRGIRKGILDENGLYKEGNDMKANMSRTPMKKGGMIKKAKSGGSFPDLNKDGKITKADILKGRGVIGKKGPMIKKAAKAVVAKKIVKSIKKK